MAGRPKGDKDPIAGKKPEQQETIVGLVLGEVDKKTLASEIAGVVTGRLERTREQIQMTKMLFEAYQAEELRGGSSQDEFAESTVLRASQLALEDNEFLRVLLTALSERKSSQERTKGRVRSDLTALLASVEEETNNDDGTVREDEDLDFGEVDQLGENPIEEGFQTFGEEDDSEEE